jgi:hypothetical protein
MKKKKVTWGYVFEGALEDNHGGFFVTRLMTDNFINVINIQYQEGQVVHDFGLSMEAAQDIGFLDFSKLEGLWDGVE